MQLRLVEEPQTQGTFDEFWKAYPRKVCKAPARRAFMAALRLTDFKTIMAGLETYKRCKPDYADWCYAATWLNNERWEDEWEDDDGKQEALNKIIDGLFE